MNCILPSSALEKLQEPHMQPCYEALLKSNNYCTFGNNISNLAIRMVATHDTHLYRFLHNNHIYGLGLTLCHMLHLFIQQGVSHEGYQKRMKDHWFWISTAIILYGEHVLV